MTAQPLTPKGEALLERVFPAGGGSAMAPAAWIAQQLGEETWSKQREIADSVATKRYTAVQSSQGIGKSWLAARLVAWWCSAHPVGEAFAVTTAPSGDQVDAILWRELDRAHQAGQLDGALTGQSGTRWWRVGGAAVALGRKSTDFVDSERAAATFQGIHARRVLVVLDEAVGIQPWLYEAVDSLVTNDDSRVLAIGNPTDPASTFAEVCAPGSGWNTIKVSAFDTPAFTGERVSSDLLAMLPSRTWVEERAKRWGVESSRYIARVLGEFPDQADDGLISRRWIAAARERDLSGEAVADPGMLAFDIGRTGDETVGYLVRGGMARLAHAAHGQDLMRTTGAIVRLIGHRRDGAARVVVDATGLGFGVVDRLREQGIGVLAFQGAERAWRPTRFLNRRAETYWRLREEFQAGRIDLDPDDDELAKQLAQIRWHENSKGQVVIESKESMRRRGVTSPDRADALAMAVGTKPPDVSPHLEEVTAGGMKLSRGPDGEWRVVGEAPRDGVPSWDFFADGGHVDLVGVDGNW
jgi:hypothetical protein